MVRSILAALSVCVFLIVGGPAAAQQAPPAELPQPAPALDEATAARAVETLEALSERGLLEEDPEPGSAQAAEAAAIIRANGFTPASWMEALHAVADGYIALKTGRWHAMPGATEEYEAMRDSLLMNPDLDEETRREALMELERRLGPQVAESPGAQAVAPFESRLDVLFDAED